MFKKLMPKSIINEIQTEKMITATYSLLQKHKFSIIYTTIIHITQMMAGKHWVKSWGM